MVANSSSKITCPTEAPDTTTAPECNPQPASHFKAWQTGLFCYSMILKSYELWPLDRISYHLHFLMAFMSTTFMSSPLVTLGFSSSYNYTLLRRVLKKPTVHCGNKDSAGTALKYTLTLTTHSPCYLAVSLLFSHPPEPGHSVPIYRNVQALPSLTSAL